ncbi:MAG: type VI secretion system tip protein VgrG, partial [Phaeodactylibacter sp.]|nr:type VI secretion system tip protein VgrG [Phaeodactylibacter sp.]
EGPIFSGIVVGHRIKARSRASFLEVTCKEAAIKLTTKRRSNYFVNIKDSDVFNQILQSYEIPKEVADTGLEHKEIVQYNCSDWDFILSRADVNGLIVTTDEGRVVIARPDFEQEPALELTYGGNIIEFEAGMDARSQYAEITTAAWDPARLELSESTAADPAFTEQGNLPASDIAGVLNANSNTLYHGGDLDAQELQAWADAGLLRNRLAKIRGRVRIRGVADIGPGKLVNLNGLGERFNGTAFVSGVHHQIHSGTWLTDLEIGMTPNPYSAAEDITDTPAAGLAPAIHGLHIGIVTQIEGDEREGHHRILVRIPFVARQGDTEGEGIWARLGTLFAGNEYGSVFRPEIGDEVILGFVNNDPRDPVVLGVLHSNTHPAPIEASNDNFEKGLYLKGAMKLAFNDDDKSILLETEAGNSILLSEREEKVIVNDQNGNRITLSSDGIVLRSAKDITLDASSGDIELKANNIKLKANMNLALEGNANAKLKGGQQAVIKGGMVMIN